MYAFFYSLYISLFTGTWTYINWTSASTALMALLDKVGEFVLNALGGNFESIQAFSWSTGSYNAINHIGALLALITMIGISFAVWKLTKMIFSIFFSRV